MFLLMPATAMFAEKTGETTNQEVSARLYSVLANYYSPVCVTLPMFINDTTRVTLHTDGGVSHTLLYRQNSVSVTGGRIWNNIRVPIALVNATHYQLEVEVKTKVDASIIAAILDVVTMEDGDCDSQGIKSSYIHTLLHKRLHILVELFNLMLRNYINII